MSAPTSSSRAPPSLAFFNAFAKNALCASVTNHTHSLGHCPAAIHSAYASGDPSSNVPARIVALAAPVSLARSNDFGARAAHDRAHASSPTHRVSSTNTDLAPSNVARIVDDENGSPSSIAVIHRSVSTSFVSTARAKASYASLARVAAFTVPPRSGCARFAAARYARRTSFIVSARASTSTSPSTRAGFASSSSSVPSVASFRPARARGSLLVDRESPRRVDERPSRSDVDGRARARDVGLARARISDVVRIRPDRIDRTTDRRDVAPRARSIPRVMSTENELLVTARYAGTPVVARVARERGDESSSSRAVTYGDVARAFARTLGLDPSTVKVHGVRECPRRVATADETTEVTMDADTKRSGRLQTFLVTGTRVDARDALTRESGVDRRVIGFEDEERRERARRGALGDGRGRSTAGSGRGRFGAVETLPTAEGTTPSRERARELLMRLATDPGVVGVMDLHGWDVGKLCEMPPEGKVGVSAACVLGYNVNNGAEIHLRLRTDDMRGFRDYVTIRRTLLHELAHNVHSNHGKEFRELNSRLNVECRRFDWKSASDCKSTRRAMEAHEPRDDDGYVDPHDVMAVTKASSGRPLGAAGATATNARDLRDARLRRFDPTVAEAESAMHDEAERALRDAGVS